MCGGEKGRRGGEVGGEGGGEGVGEGGVGEAIVVRGDEGARRLKFLEHLQSKADQTLLAGG